MISFENFTFFIRIENVLDFIIMIYKYNFGQSDVFYIFYFLNKNHTHFLCYNLLKYLHL